MFGPRSALDEAAAQHILAGKWISTQLGATDWMNNKSPSVWEPGLFSRSVTKQITSGVTEQYRIKVCVGLEYVKLYTETLGFVLPGHLGSSESISQGTKQGKGSAPASRLGGQRNSGYSMLQPHTWTSSQGCQQLGTAIPTAVCPILFAEYFAFLMEGSTHACERKQLRKERQEGNWWFPALPLCFWSWIRIPRKKQNHL